MKIWFLADVQEMGASPRVLCIRYDRNPRLFSLVGFEKILLIFVLSGTKRYHQRTEEKSRDEKFVLC